MQNYRSEHGVITWTNGTGTAVAAGDVVALGARVGIAMVDIAATASGSVMVVGVFRLAKDTSVFAASAEVFWDVSEKKATSSPGTGDLRLGVAPVASLTGDAYLEVDLNVNRCGGNVGTAIDSGAGDAAGNFAVIKLIIGLLENAGIVIRK